MRIVFEMYFKNTIKTITNRKLYEMKHLFFTIIVLSTLLFSCKKEKKKTNPETTKIETNLETNFKIVFGSCAHQNKPQPLLKVAKSLKPDAFIYLGDNIYGDTYSIDTLRAKYNKLGAKPEFKDLINSTAIYSVWDDHDFGDNDMGRHYPLKKESEKLFLDFWKVPADSERRTHEGIYGAETIKKNDKILQIILLDTRYFRDDLVHRQKSDTIYKNDYVPNQVPDSTFLGTTQWSWLEKEFKKPADVRIIASSNQFSHEYNGWESWTNVPHERQKMVDLIAKTKANGVIFISGDVHWGEISKLKTKNTYPIYDVTSSGITQTWYNTEPNKNRIGKVIPQNNIGLIEVNFKDKLAEVSLGIVDSTKLKVTEHTFPLSNLEF